MFADFDAPMLVLKLLSAVLCSEGEVVYPFFLSLKLA